MKPVNLIDHLNLLSNLKCLKPINIIFMVTWRKIEWNHLNFEFVWLHEAIMSPIIHLHVPTLKNENTGHVDLQMMASIQVEPPLAIAKAN